LIEHTITVGPSFESKVVAELVQKATQFKSHVSLVLEEKTANAKSIMGIISLNLQNGNTVSIVANGEDENQVISELEIIIGN
jgi:phosphotransferase system HPr (HPr) family protein